MKTGLATVALGALAVALPWLAGAALAADKGEIVVFVPSSTNPYIGQFEKGAKAKGQELGYSVKAIENNFNQSSRTAKSSSSSPRAKGCRLYLVAVRERGGIGALRALSKSVRR